MHDDEGSSILRGTVFAANRAAASWSGYITDCGRAEKRGSGCALRPNRPGSTLRGECFEPAAAGRLQRPEDERAEVFAGQGIAGAEPERPAEAANRGGLRRLPVPMPYAA